MQEMRRALFMYAKLNPGLRYIQGMNELIAPLYYLFKNDPDPHSQAYAEADAFWCVLQAVRVVGLLLMHLCLVCALSSSLQVPSYSGRHAPISAY